MTTFQVRWLEVTHLLNNCKGLEGGGLEMLKNTSTRFLSLIDITAHGHPHTCGPLEMATCNALMQVMGHIRALMNHEHSYTELTCRVRNGSGVKAKVTTCQRIRVRLPDRTKVGLLANQRRLTLL